VRIAVKVMETVGAAAPRRRPIVLVEQFLEKRSGVCCRDRANAWVYQLRPARMIGDGPVRRKLMCDDGWRIVEGRNQALLLRVSARLGCQDKIFQSSTAPQ
jgi:hypothetical protein